MFILNNIKFRINSIQFVHKYSSSFHGENGIIIAQAERTGKEPVPLTPDKKTFIMRNISSAAFKDSKPHFALLDGLRGVAALLVVWYHVFEGYAFARGTAIESFNHGYLAVDFFFILSGFVIGYAYDDRWRTALTMQGFFKRRLIRLHPMVVMGAVLGVVSFLIQGSEKWDGTHVGISLVMLSLLCAMFFIPAVPGACYEVRGNGEMFPLNGPSWSLFFEYIGNILYALFIRRLSTRALTVVVFWLAGMLTTFTTLDISGYGSFGVGWTMDCVNFLGGLLRMLFPFTMGMLLFRRFKPMRVKGAFWICSVILIGLFSVPFIEGAGDICLNGVYEAFCIIVVFPLLIRMGASEAESSAVTATVCRCLGDISYPLYITHYTVMYLFYSWLIERELYTLGETWQVVACVYTVNIIIACLCLKLYDEPVRRWLSRKFLGKG